MGIEKELNRGLSHTPNGNFGHCGRLRPAYESGEADAPFTKTPNFRLMHKKTKVPLAGL